MNYRLATQLDVAQLADRRWEYWLEDGEAPAELDKQAFSRQFIDWLTPRLSGEWTVWCAVENERVLSHVYVQRIEKLPKPSAPLDQFGYVTNVYTCPSHRSRGIGAKLIKEVAAWALESNLEFLVLWPSEDSIPFWKRADFQETEALLREIRPYIN